MTVITASTDSQSFRLLEHALRRQASFLEGKEKRTKNFLAVTTDAIPTAHIVTVVTGVTHDFYYDPETHGFGESWWVDLDPSVPIADRWWADAQWFEVLSNMLPAVSELNADLRAEHAETEPLHLVFEQTHRSLLIKVISDSEAVDPISLWGISTSVPAFETLVQLDAETLRSENYGAQGPADHKPGYMPGGVDMQAVFKHWEQAMEEEFERQRVLDPDMFGDYEGWSVEDCDCFCARDEMRKRAREMIHECLAAGLSEETAIDRAVVACSDLIGFNGADFGCGRGMRDGCEFDDFADAVAASAVKRAFEEAASVKRERLARDSYSYLS